MNEEELTATNKIIALADVFSSLPEKKISSSDIGETLADFLEQEKFTEEMKIGAYALVMRLIISAHADNDLARHVFSEILNGDGEDA